MVKEPSAMREPLQITQHSETVNLRHVPIDTEAGGGMQTGSLDSSMMKQVIFHHWS